jgi:hypothetical protein
MNIDLLARFRSENIPDASPVNRSFAKHLRFNPQGLLGKPVIMEGV